jgi:hypothetical protein
MKIVDLKTMREAVLDRYEDLFAKLKADQHQALFWEQYGFETVFVLLRGLHVPFEIQPDDIRPWVKTRDGQNVEIDFRITIRDQLVYFDVTAFYEREQDLRKDLIEVISPAYGIKRHTYQGSRLISSEALGDGQLTITRRKKDYLDRRIAVRIAREGKHDFPCDHVYVFFPMKGPALGGGIDGIPASFQFGTAYYYKETGIAGLVLVGESVQTEGREMKIRKEQWRVRTRTFPRCSPMMESILKSVDTVTISNTNRLKSVWVFLERHKDDPAYKEMCENFLAEYGDIMG